MDLNLEVLLQFIMSLWGDKAEAMAQQFLGRPSLGRNILSNDAERTMAYNAYMSDRARMLNGFSAIRDNLSFMATRNMFDNVGGIFGSKAGGSYADSFVGTLVSNLMFAPKFGAASAAFGQAVYGQQYLWDWRLGTQGVTPGTAANFFNNTGALFQSVMTDAMNGGVGGLGIVDSGKLLAAYTRLGGANILANTASTLNEDGTAKSGTDLERRITRIKSDLKEYAGAVNALRDVINGPMEKILADFEQLTGNNMMAMASGRASSIANTMRSILLTGNVSFEDVRALNTLQAGMLAPLGYNRTQISQLSLANAASMAAGTKIEGLDKDRMAAALSRDTAQRALRGEYRSVAAAYVHWLDKNGLEDDPYAQTLFRQEMTQNGKDLLTASREYADKNQLSSAFRHSARVDNVLGNAAFAAELRVSGAQKFFNWREQELKKLGLKPDLINEINQTYDPAEIERLLVSGGVDSNRAAAIVSNMTRQAQLTTGTADKLSAWGMLSGARKGAMIAQRDLLSRNFMLMGDIVSSKGLEGVINWLASGAHDKEARSLAAIASAALGLNPTQQAELRQDPSKFYAKNLTAEQKEILNTVLIAGQQDASLAGSIIALGKNTKNEDAANTLLRVLANKGAENIDEKTIREQGKALGANAEDIERLVYRRDTGRWLKNEDWSKVYAAAKEFAGTRFDILEEYYGEAELGAAGAYDEKDGKLTERAQKARLQMGLYYADRLHAARTAVNALRMTGDDSSDEAMKRRIFSTDKTKALLSLQTGDVRELTRDDYSEDFRHAAAAVGVKFEKDGTAIVDANQAKLLQAAIKDDSVAGILRNIFSLLSRSLGNLGGGKTS